MLIHVVPPLLLTVTPFPATPTNNLAVPSPSLGVCHCNKTWYAEFARAKFHDCFCTNTFYFNWPNFLSVGIVDIAFQSAGTGKSATPTGHLDFHLAPFTVSYEFFPRWNQKQFDFFSIEHKSRLQLLSEEFRVSYFRKKSCQAAIMRICKRVAGTCYPTRCTCFYFFCRRTSSVTYGRIDHALVEQGKDKTVKNIKSLKRSIGVVIANVPANCILRSHIRYSRLPLCGTITPAPRVI